MGSCDSLNERLSWLKWKWVNLRRSIDSGEMENDTSKHSSSRSIGSNECRRGHQYRENRLVDELLNVIDCGQNDRGNGGTWPDLLNSISVMALMFTRTFYSSWSWRPMCVGSHNENGIEENEFNCFVQNVVNRNWFWNRNHAFRDVCGLQLIVSDWFIDSDIWWDYLSRILPKNN